MSANNWAVCPRCVAPAVKMRAEAQALYGKVDLPAYERKMQEARDAAPESDTLREDYEIGIWKGKFSVSYGGSCTECGFQFSYKHEEVIK